MVVRCDNFEVEREAKDLPEDYRVLPDTDRLEMRRNGLTSRNYSKNSLSDGRVNLQWKDITYKTPDGITILEHLSGSSNSGEMTAIMGPSGSGKTSLVNILSGFSQKRMTGQVLVNGTKRDMSTFRNFTCYVLQDDHVLSRLTVKEILTFAAKLKFQSTVSEKERQKAVDGIILGLGLTGQQHQSATTLSGGQRKRLCIAQEVVNNPQLIILDEPTSGLDSSSCLQCIQLLKSMAEKGKNIICTIHQPSSRIYEIFDNLYMISDGACIYRGSTKNLLPFLAEHNLECSKYQSPTDFLMDIAIGLYGDSAEKLKDVIRAADDLNASWNQIDVDDISNNEDKKSKMSLLGSIKNKITEISQDCRQDLSKSYATSNFNQFRVLLMRYFLQQLRDPIHIQLKFFGNIVIGLILGSLYYDVGNDGSKIFPTVGVLFTFLVFIISSSMVPTILTFPLQMTVFEREYRNGWYSTMMLYLATTVAEIPYQIISPMFNCFFFYWLSGQPMEIHRFSLFALSSILICLNSQSLSFLIGTVYDIEGGCYLAIVVSGIVSTFHGHLLPLNDTPFFYRWLCIPFLYTYYGMHSMIVNMLSNRAEFDCTKGICFFKEPGYFLRYYKLEESLLMDYAFMIISLVILNLCCYLLLHSRLSRLK